MVGTRGGIAIVAALGLLVAGCGEQPTAAEFDPTVAEEFVANKARADVRANPVLAIKTPLAPEVTCDERDVPGGRAAAEDDDATFICDVEIQSAEERTLAQQRWRTQVELDPITGDTVVRRSLRQESTIDPAR